MNHHVDTPTREQILEQRGIAHVANDEIDRPTGKGFDAIDGAAMTARQIVDDDHTESGRRQLDADVRADVSGASGNEDGLSVHRDSSRASRPSLFESSNLS